MRAIGSSILAIGTTLMLALSSVPAVAGLPGSTQPGAQPVVPGNLILMRAVPPRNAIISGAGGAITAPTAPPSVVFATIQGVGQPLSDSEAALVAGSVDPGQGGRDVAATIDGVLGSQSISGAAAPERAGGAGLGTDIGGSVRSAVGTIGGILGNLGGHGH